MLASLMLSATIGRGEGGDNTDPTEKGNDMTTRKTPATALAIAAVLGASLTVAPAPVLAQQSKPLGGLFACEGSGKKQEGGALIGAAAGALLGSKLAKNEQTLGALVGAAAGAAAGAYIGCRMQSTDAALAEHRQTVLQALEEVESNLVRYAQEQIRRRTLTAAAADARKAQSLARDLYERGLKDIVNVLEAQRALSEAEEALITSETAAMTDLIALYKALGGGWSALDRV